MPGSELKAVRDELKRVVQGQDVVVDQLLTALTAGGHVLLEGVPGVAKTLLGRSLAAALHARFARIQFTPDLMPTDITGVNVFDSQTVQFRFRPGPIFADVILVDEINRAPAKTQAALLEAMQEKQVTLDGETHALPEVFTVLATQNPIEYEGTYPLPEAQLDRFLMKVVVSYPSQEHEGEMLSEAHRLGADWERPNRRVRPVADVDQLLKARQTAHAVEIDGSVVQYILAVIRRSRDFPSFSLGASPRAAVMLMIASKAAAILRGQTYVTPDDVKEMVLPVLRHRVRLTPEAQIEGLDADQCLQSLLQQVPVPR